MQLALEAISKQVGDETWLHPMDLHLKPNAMTVLLGATQAGKTSLMRIMAGLDAPGTGRVMVDDQDVTGWSVRRRNVAMVYQQFINYPSMTVRENIASPLKLRRESNIAARVESLAERLGIAAFLDRLPVELSGGQQQRVALARALAKAAPLTLLDEPLVNLDYKLRETLREELADLFFDGCSTVVYATTEPGEALLLGGHTAVLHEGRLLQYGAAVEVYDNPVSLEVARTFNDPPMNFMSGVREEDGVRLPSGHILQLAMPSAPDSVVTLGLRAGALKLKPWPQANGASAQRPMQTIQSRVALAEISGSDTFLHVETDAGPLVAQFTGVHHFELGETLPLYFSERDAFVFSADGHLLRAPNRGVAEPWHA